MRTACVRTSIPCTVVTMLRNCTRRGAYDRIHTQTHAHTQSICVCCASLCTEIRLSRPTRPGQIVSIAPSTRSHHTHAQAHTKDSANCIIRIVRFRCVAPAPAHQRTTGRCIPSTTTLLDRPPSEMANKFRTQPPRSSQSHVVVVVVVVHRSAHLQRPRCGAEEGGSTGCARDRHCRRQSARSGPLCAPTTQK